MTRAEVIRIIKEELPTIYMEDGEIHQFVIRLATGKFAEKYETESRFDRILNALERDREENMRKWEALHAEEKRRWDEHKAEEKRQWDEEQQRWEAHEAEEKRRWDAQLEELRQQREDDNKKWNMFDRKYQASIGALGARWGINSETSFRNALKSILEESFDVKVLNVTEFDESGEVFGSPDQVEIDVIVKNGVLILCEIKSSISRGDVLVFSRKIAFYERRHSRKATRMIIISPMIEASAKALAQKLGMEFYSYADDVSEEK